MPVAKKASRRNKSAAAETANASDSSSSPANGKSTGKSSAKKSTGSASKNSGRKKAHASEKPTAKIPARKSGFDDVPEDVRVPELAAGLDEGDKSSSDSGRHEAQVDAIAERRRRYKTTHQKYKTAKIGVDTQIINGFFFQARSIRAAHPRIDAELDFNQWKIEQRLKNIRDAIDQLPEEGREIITVMIINDIHRLCDQILIDPEVNEAAAQVTDEDEA